MLEFAANTLLEKHIRFIEDVYLTDREHTGEPQTRALKPAGLAREVFQALESAGAKGITLPPIYWRANRYRAIVRMGYTFLRELEPYHPVTLFGWRDFFEELNEVRKATLAANFTTRTFIYIAEKEHYCAAFALARSIYDFNTPDGLDELLRTGGSTYFARRACKRLSETSEDPNYALLADAYCALLARNYIDDIADHPRCEDVEALGYLILRKAEQWHTPSTMHKALKQGKKHFLFEDKPSYPLHTCWRNI